MAPPSIYNTPPASDVKLSSPRSRGISPHVARFWHTIAKSRNRSLQTNTAIRSHKSITTSIPSAVYGDCAFCVVNARGSNRDRTREKLTTTCASSWRPMAAAGLTEPRGRHCERFASVQRELGSRRNRPHPGRDRRRQAVGELFAPPRSERSVRAEATRWNRHARPPHSQGSRPNQVRYTVEQCVATTDGRQHPRNGPWAENAKRFLALHPLGQPCLPPSSRPQSLRGGPRTALIDDKAESVVPFPAVRSRTICLPKMPVQPCCASRLGRLR